MVGCVKEADYKFHGVTESGPMFLNAINAESIYRINVILFNGLRKVYWISKCEANHY